MTDKTAPKRIWLQTDGNYAECMENTGENQVTWCWRRIADDDQEYVRADIYSDALAEVERLKAEAVRARRAGKPDKLELKR